MSTTKNARSIKSLLNKLGAKYKDEMPPPREAMEELLFSFLLWESTWARADAAFKRMQSRMVDFNELRVCGIDEIAGVLGKTYPLAEERAGRLKDTLNELYRDHHAVSLEACQEMNKRDARTYLESLEGMTPFVSARVMLVVLGAHAVPVDQKLAQRLIEAEAIDETDADPASISASLERAIKSADSLQAHWLFQQWSDDPKSTVKKAKSPRKKTTRTKTTTRKKTARSASRK